MADRINKLDGKAWLQNSFSIWRDVQKNNEERKLKHPAMFPIALAERLIDCFTNKQGLRILDPFMGSGSTLIAAQNKNNIGIGFELNATYIKMTKNRLDNVYKSLFTKTSKKNYFIYNANTKYIRQYIKSNSIDFAITSPPYWDILNRKRSADRKEIHNYGKQANNLGNISDYNQFLSALKEIFVEVYNVIKPKGYCIVIVMDIRKGSHLYRLHSDLTKKMEEIGFSLKDIIIWDRQKEYNNMRPLGYPYSFIINKVHEYILIFRKPDIVREK
jgi:DNA modification methylase